VVVRAPLLLLCLGVELTERLHVGRKSRLVGRTKVRVGAPQRGVVVVVVVVAADAACA
jgi:hypothetical protein